MRTCVIVIKDEVCDFWSFLLHMFSYIFQYTHIIILICSRLWVCGANNILMDHSCLVEECCEHDIFHRPWFPEFLFRRSVLAMTPARFLLCGWIEMIYSHFISGDNTVQEFWFCLQPQQHFAAVFHVSIELLMCQEMQHPVTAHSPHLQLFADYLIYSPKKDIKHWCYLVLC